MILFIFYKLNIKGTKLEESQVKQPEPNVATDADGVVQSKRSDMNLKKRAYRATEDDVVDIYQKELNLYRQSRLIKRRVLETHPEMHDILRNLDPHDNDQNNKKSNN